MTAELSDEFDPELPILAELEQQLHLRLGPLATTTADALGPERSIARGARTSSPSYRGAGRRVAPAARDQQPAQGTAGSEADRARHRGDHPRRRLLRRGGVIARRSGVLVGLGLLVGATALATRTFVGSSAGGDPSLRTTAAAQIASGRPHGETWTLSASRRGEDLCDAFFVDGLVATRCDAPPAPGATVVDSLRSSRSHYVVGLAAADVRSVVIEAGGARRTVATRLAAGGADVMRANLPRGLRWFVVRFPRGTGDGAARAVRVAPRARVR